MTAEGSDSDDRPRQSDHKLHEARVLRAAQAKKKQEDLSAQRQMHKLQADMLKTEIDGILVGLQKSITHHPRSPTTT